MNAITPIAPPHPRRASTAFVQVRSGACVDLLVPDLSAVTLEDIATSLSRTNRFNGATLGDQPYSVAQHSLMVAEAVEHWGFGAPMQLSALFHDAAEAILGDVITPVKRCLGTAWHAMESRMHDAMRRRFHLTADPACYPISDADAALLATERRDLLHASAWEWGCDLPPPLPIKIIPLHHSTAYARWLGKARALADRCGVDLDRTGTAP